VQVPAVCDNCGTFFPSGVAVCNARNVTIYGCSSGPCPHCGGMGHIPDGTYNFINDAIQLLSTPTRTFLELNRLSTILKQAREQRSSLEQVGEQIQREVPEFTRLTDIFPKTRAELYAFISIVLSILMLIFSQIRRDTPSKIEINQVINLTYQNQGRNNQYIGKRRSDYSSIVNPAKKANKVGRNAPCPCGSGKKYKKCCLGNN